MLRGAPNDPNIGISGPFHRQRARETRFVVAACSLSFFLGDVGCTQLKPVFEEHDPPIVWPAPPARPRIRYVGALRSSGDLKARRSFFQSVGDLFVGSEPVEPIRGPRSVVCMPDGARVWIADPGGRCLHFLDLEKREYKKLVQLAGNYLRYPASVCLGPEDSIYVCDSERVAIDRLDASTGSVLESLRLPEDVVRPIAMCFDERAGELYVVDVDAHDIKVLGPHGGLRRILGRRGTKPGEFNFPCGITCDGELLWITDAGNHRVQGVNTAGVPVASFGQAGDAPGDLALPKGIAVDTDGHLYVTDGRFENVQVFDASGRLLLVFGDEGTGPGEFWLPGGIFIDSRNRVWICDTYNGRVQVFDYLGVKDAAHEVMP